MANFLNKQDLKTLLGTNRLETVVKILAEVPNGVIPYFENDYPPLQASFSNYHSQVISGSLTGENERVERAMLIKRFLLFIDELPNQPIPVSEKTFRNWKKTQSTTPSKSERIKRIVISALVMLALLCAGYLLLPETGQSLGCFPLPESITSEPNSVTNNPNTAQPQIKEKLDTSIPIVFINFENLTQSPSKIIIDNKDTLPYAVMDDGYKPGNEAVINDLTDACAFRFTVKNPGSQVLTITNIFVDVQQYSPLPNQQKLIKNRPFQERAVAYLRIGNKRGRYKKAFYFDNGQRDPWKTLEVPPEKSVEIAVRINTEVAGKFQFRLGVMYSIQHNNTSEEKYVSPRVKYAFITY